MPRHITVKVIFNLPGFYLGEGAMFPSEDRLMPRRLLHSIIGEAVTEGRTGAAKVANLEASVKLFELAIELKDVFIAVRGHRSFFETLAPRWNEHIHGEVDVDDLMKLFKFWVKARRSYRGRADKTKLANLVDQWIEIDDDMESLDPLPTATVVVAGQPKNVAGITAELEGVAVGERTDAAANISEPWPPAHFSSGDKVHLLDPQVQHKLQGISTAFFGDSGPPDLPNKRTVLVDTKIFVAYWALRTSKPEKLWSICIVPAGPFWTSKDREQWRNVTGNCSRTLATVNGFLKRATIAFDEGKTTMIGLLTPWIGSAEQVEAAATAASINNNPTKIWSEKCPRQGLVLIIRRTIVDGQHKIECFLYDPTMNCPRLRAESWVKGALVHLFAYRQGLKDQIQKAFEGHVIRTWIGGSMTGLDGEPDSVEMSAAFLRSAISTDEADPFDMDEKDWRRHGFAVM